MSNYEKAFKLFDEMYSERRLRDSAYEVFADLVNDSPEKADIFRKRATRHNKASMQAESELVALGFFAWRDSENGFMATLTHNGELVAYWHGFGEVEIMSK